MQEDSLPRLLYHDAHLAVVDKPAGMPVHGSRLFADRPTTVAAWLRKTLGCVVHPVHRLDRAVSGVLLFALDRDSLVACSNQFEQREVHKHYLAVVRGWLPSGGRIEHALRPPRDERKATDEAREAVTEYHRLATAELPFPVKPYATARYSLAELSPLTGRRHQLRRHLKHISHHLVGDTTYGKGEHNRLFREQFNCPRLLLHGWKLELRHPHSHQPLAVMASPRGVFEEVLKKLGWAESLAQPRV